MRRVALELLMLQMTVSRCDLHLPAKSGNEENSIENEMKDSSTGRAAPAGGDALNSIGDDACTRTAQADTTAAKTLDSFMLLTVREQKKTARDT